jgi:hypothetical protein
MNFGARKVLKKLHDQIVDEFLPQFAKRLKAEGIISNSNRRPFKLHVLDSLSPFVIKPDRVFYLLDGRKVLIEVASLRDPKRFMGELTYAEILLQKRLISAALFYVIGEHGSRKSQERSLVEKWTLTDIVTAEKQCWTISWQSEEISYFNLREVLTNPNFLPRIA